MTRREIERFAKVVKQFVGKLLLNADYEGMGEQDRDDFVRDFDEIINLALKGLEHLQNVPDTNVGECNDCISRQAVLDLLQMRLMPKEEYKAIYELPPVTPQLKWIPVSERLPEKTDMYTVTDSKGDVVRFVFNDTESSRKYWLRCAKAWMPLPDTIQGKPDRGREVEE